MNKFKKYLIKEFFIYYLEDIECTMFNQHICSNYSTECFVDYRTDAFTYSINHCKSLSKNYSVSNQENFKI